MDLGPNQRSWVEALRSGEYEQGGAALQLDGKFCCLGVACDLARKAGVEVTLNEDDEIEGETLGEQPAVKEWLGLSSFAGVISLSDSLTSMNDRGESFEAISDAIEDNRNKLFYSKK